MPTAPRLATPDDLPALTRIVDAAYTPYIARIGRKPGPMLDDYAALVAAGQVHVLERDGEVQGLVVLIPQGDSMLLDNIAVAPAGQGKGLGRCLLAFAEATAEAAGYDAITLYTNEAMVENIGLYQRGGFVETHRAEERGFRRVYMRKPLTG
jgi:ribosomal protein S18 acetylase RimI-like enzyme